MFFLTLGLHRGEQMADRSFFFLKAVKMDVRVPYERREKG